MDHKVYENWPDYAALSQHGEGATLRDDMGRGSLTIQIVPPYWTERAVFAHDSKTRGYAQFRFANPLDGSCFSPHTIRAVYNLQGAMLKDLQPDLGMPNIRRTDKVRDCECVVYNVSRTGEHGHGSIGVQRINRNWLGLTVVNEDMCRANSADTATPQDERDTVTLFFNRLRSPHVYQGLLALGQAIRRDNHYFPREIKQVASPSAA